MFDTGQASRLLQKQSYGLAFLLSHYCNVNADKKYQLADWRLRPLPKEMLKYAREDTHYLLFIYDSLSQELQEKNLYN
jgi:exosome complex exonuclease RRP6